MSSEFGQTATICNTCTNTTARFDEREQRNEAIELISVKSSNDFLMEFLKLKLGGVLMKNFEADAFLKVLLLYLFLQCFETGKQK